jgi:hypothetical protein
MPDPCKPESLTTKFNFNINSDMWDDHDGFTSVGPNIFVENNALPGFQEQVNQIINAINCGINKIECECLKNKVRLNTFTITSSALVPECAETLACTVNNRMNIILENIFRPGDDNPVDLCLLIYHELMHTIDDCEACYDDQLSAEIDRITKDFYVKFKNQIPAIEKEIIDTLFKNNQFQEWMRILFNGFGSYEGTEYTFDGPYDIQKIAAYIRDNILALNSRFFDNANEFRAYANQFCVKGIHGIISEFLYLEFTNSMPELADFERIVNTIAVDIITDIYQKYFQENLIQYCRSINELRTGGCNTDGLNIEFELKLKPTSKTTLSGDSLIISQYDVQLIVNAEKNSCCRKTQGRKGLKDYATVTLCPQCPKKCIFYYESIDNKLMPCVFEQLFMGCETCSTIGRTQGEGMLSIHKLKESIIKDFDDAIFNSVAGAFPGLVRGREGCPC